MPTSKKPTPKSSNTKSSSPSKVRPLFSKTKNNSILRKNKQVEALESSKKELPILTAKQVLEKKEFAKINNNSTDNNHECNNHEWQKLELLEFHIPQDISLKLEKLAAYEIRTKNDFILILISLGLESLSCERHLAIKMNDGTELSNSKWDSGRKVDDLISPLVKDIQSFITDYESRKF